MRRTNLLALILLLLLCAVSQGAFKFVAWADNRPLYEDNRERFRWMLQQMNLIVGSEPLFHVVPGDYDYTYMTNDDIAEFSDIKTWHPAPGNHDEYDLNNMLNNAVYLGDPQTLFLFLNEYQCPAGVCSCSLGRVCEHTLAWLYEMCELAPGGFPIFVVGHEPAFPEGYHVDDSLNLYPDDRDAFWALLKQYRATYICAHTHYYSTYSSGGATQIDVGNAGNPREPQQTFVEVVVTDTDVTFTAWHGQIDAGYVVRDFWTVDLAAASNLSPADEATQVAVDTDLEWRAGAGAVSHDVYFGTGPSSLLLESKGQSTTTYDPGTLVNNTTYYWRIDEFDGFNKHQGDVWSFTTFVPELPWIDGFESGSFADGGWTTSGNASVSSKADYFSIYGAEIKGTAWIEKAISTVGFSNINIKYVRKTKGLDVGEYLYVEWHDGSDGSPWNLLKYIQSTDWSLQNLTCETGANDNADFKVRFRTNGSNSAEYAYVDDVEIYESTVVTPPPEPASNPSPADGASNIAVTAEMSWTAGAGAQSHDVYFGTDDPPPSLQNQSETTFDPGILINNTIYYWRIDEKNSYGTTQGQVWSFSTQSAGSTVYVSDIAMDIITAKKYYATATVQISPTLEGATVVGDWYFKGVLRLSGATGVVTDADGTVTAVLTSFVTPAKTGDTFTFTVTDVVADGYIYDESENLATTDSITVP